MKNSVNKVILIGNTTRDIELRQAGGTSVCEVGLALNKSWKTPQGTFKEEVTFVDITLWGKMAEWVSKDVPKGSMVYVEGSLQLSEWEDPQTKQKRRKLRILGEQFRKLATPKPKDAAAAIPGAANIPPPAAIPAGDDYVEF